ncbi:MAG: hypothetical protein KGD68_09195 [Candidatus Lokiarchaeota archaeon]|nr:hypothetical protein [Candidatus Lokiarchaeota archaeon]
MIDSVKIDIEKIKHFLFSKGRLIERKLFSYFFEGGLKEEVLKVLVGYQNRDGGFGNGIEPDLLCPDSTAIGAETALYILDLLDSKDSIISTELIKWILETQNKEGYINHPPENMFKYPYQPWWKNLDKDRIFVLAGILKKWSAGNEQFFKNVRVHYQKTEFPKEFVFYNYPIFVYLKYCSQNNEDNVNLEKIIECMPSLLGDNRDHFPLFSRYWYYAIDHVSQDTMENEAAYFIDSFEEDGGIKIAYQNLPWWRPIFSLDGLILLKKYNLLK